MAKKKKVIKKEDNFYGEDNGFSDDPEDSFYAVGESDDDAPLRRKSGPSSIFFMGFMRWEFGVVVIEIVLVIYLLLVLLGQMPLF